MSDFKRARSLENKKSRLEEVKRAADELFSNSSYHDINMSVIADKLDWSRANLYRYANSKEEIFLELVKDKMNSYFEALKTILIPEANYSNETLSEIWAGIICKNRDYFKYAELLNSIIETNVSIEKLAEFKKSFYKNIAELEEILGQCLNISKEQARELFFTTNYHAIGFCGLERLHPKILKAVDLAGLEREKVDLSSNMKFFIKMCLDTYSKDENE